MKDARRLKSKIARLANASGGHDAEGRPILSGEHTDGLTAVLREIDETILPRSLTLSSARGAIVMPAGNRRLIAIETVAGDALAEVASVGAVSALASTMLAGSPKAQEGECWRAAKTPGCDRDQPRLGVRRRR